MKEVKLQIRINAELKEQWIKEAGLLGITLTQLIMNRMGAGVILPKRGQGVIGDIVVSKTTESGSIPDGPARESFKTYFK